MLASGFCFKGDERLSTAGSEGDPAEESVLVNVWRNSSGGGESRGAGGGERRDGGGDRRDGMGEVNGVPSGGLRILLIGWPRCESWLALENGELALGELPGATG